MHVLKTKNSTLPQFPSKTYLYVGGKLLHSDTSHSHLYHPILASRGTQKHHLHMKIHLNPSNYPLLPRKDLHIDHHCHPFCAFRSNLRVGLYDLQTYSIFKDQTPFSRFLHVCSPIPTRIDYKGFE